MIAAAGAEADVSGDPAALLGAPERLAQRLREANERLLLAVIEAHDLAEKAEQARVHAEAAAEALRATERELRATAAAREELLGVVGHDLRNPLSTIQLTAVNMNRRRVFMETDVARILRSAGRMERMIRQLLDFTRLRLGGGFQLDRQPVDLGSLCAQAIEDLPPRAECALRCEVQGEVTGSWDADLLMEVLANILGNAQSYATPGTLVQVQVRDEGAEVVADISNQGVPIPAELQPVLFDAFRRARQEGSVRSGHLGLGLYIAHQFVVAHGGAIAACSAGGTTTFTIRLPRGG